MSFRCRKCGGELVKRGGAGALPDKRQAPLRPPRSVPAVGVARAREPPQPVNPYAAPVAGGLRPFVESADAGMLASPGNRLLAQILDGLLGVALYVPFIIAGGLFAGDSDDPNAALTVAIALFIAGLVTLAVYQIWHLSTEGPTLGKKLMHIRIVNYDGGGNPGFGRAVGLPYSPSPRDSPPPHFSFCE